MWATLASKITVGDKFSLPKCPKLEEKKEVKETKESKEDKEIRELNDHYKKEHKKEHEKECKMLRGYYDNDPILPDISEDESKIVIAKLYDMAYTYLSKNRSKYEKCTHPDLVHIFKEVGLRCYVRSPSLYTYYGTITEYIIVEFTNEEKTYFVLLDQLSSGYPGDDDMVFGTSNIKVKTMKITSKFSRIT